MEAPLVMKFIFTLKVLQSFSLGFDMGFFQPIQGANGNPTLNPKVRYLKISSGCI